MLSTFSYLHLVWMAAAVVLEVTANLFIKASNGFARRWIGCAGLLSVVLSFACLSKAVEGIALSVAYAIWGGCGVVATSMLGATLFGQRIRPLGWAGIATIISGMMLLKFA